VISLLSYGVLVIPLYLPIGICWWSHWNWLYWGIQGEDQTVRRVSSKGYIEKRQLIQKNQYMYQYSLFYYIGRIIKTKCLLQIEQPMMCTKTPEKVRVVRKKKIIIKAYIYIYQEHLARIICKAPVWYLCRSRREHSNYHWLPLVYLQTLLIELPLFHRNEKMYMSWMSVLCNVRCRTCKNKYFFYNL
jgi:hypothetical protein